MNNKQIDKLFELMETTTPLNRENIRSLYLDCIGINIIPFCKKWYIRSSQAEMRTDMIRFTIRYARISDEAKELAIIALKDRSKNVRRMACAVMAYSLDEEMISYLNSIKEHKNTHTQEKAKSAILAIKTKDINNFVKPSYNVWSVTQDSDTLPTKEKIDFYIKTKAPTLIEPINLILGSIYPDKEPEKC